MRKVQSFDLFMGNSHSPTFLFAGRALARKSSGEGDSHTPAQRQCKRSRFTFLNTFFCFFQVMESQGQLPLQGASSSGPLAGGADEEFVPLLQVMCGADFDFFMNDVFCDIQLEKCTDSICAASIAPAARLSRARF